MSSSSLNNLNASSSDNTQKRPSRLWWLLALVIFSICILVQLPVAWLVQKYAPNTPYIQWISGNLWQGSASLQLPSPASKGANNVNINATATTANPSQPISATLTWQWQPLKLFLGKLAADINLTSGQTRLTGDMNIGLNSLQMNKLSGRIHQDTLASMVNWQLPDAPIQVNNLTVHFDNDEGINEADGQLTWVGGQLGYPNAGKTYQINIPAMRADISHENKGEGTALHAHLVNDQDKTLGDFYLDNQGMLDIALTQRLLENMPSYSGSAPQDTAVVSIRQPLKPYQRLLKLQKVGSNNQSTSN